MQAPVPLRSPAVLIRLMPSCAALSVAAVLVVAGCDSGDGRELREPTQEQRIAATTSSSTSTTIAGAVGDPTAMTAGSVAATVTPTVAPASFTLQAPWTPGTPIDVRFTCDGAGRSPLLTWSAPPAGTVEMALLVTDDDAAGFVHWAVAAIAPAAGEVGEGATITGALEGANDAGTVGWTGPCPPSGGPHTYRFALYALGQQSELPDGFSGDELASLANSTGLGYAEVTGTYNRAGG